MENKHINHNVTQKTVNFKHKILALFQFFSTVGLISLFLSIFLMGYTILEHDLVDSIKNVGVWYNQIEYSITFSELKTTGILAGLLFYIFIGLWMVANIFGWLMFMFKNRNLFDQLFLIFLMIPIMSNLFALFSQLATKKIEYTRIEIDKEAIIKNQTRVYKIAFRKAEEEANKRKGVVKPKKVEKTKKDLNKNTTIKPKNKPQTKIATKNKNNNL